MITHQSLATYADQRRSRLMSLPQELRNRVYEYVFTRNVTRSVEVVRHHRNADHVKACMPRRIRLDKMAPPNKDLILTCRQLYAEMMQAAACRRYWPNNRFAYPYAEISSLGFDQAPALDDAKIMRVRCFSLLLSPQLTIEIDFKHGRWIPRVLLAPGHPLDWAGGDLWHDYQGKVEDAVLRSSILCSRRRSGHPCLGQGLTGDMIRELSRGICSYFVFDNFSRMLWECAETHAKLAMRAKASVEGEGTRD